MALGGLRGRFLLDDERYISVPPTPLCGKSRGEADTGGIGREDDDAMAMAMFVRGILDDGWSVPFMPV